MSIESVMPSNHLILCRLLLLLPSIFPSIRVFSNESDLRIRWPKYWSFSFSISTSNEYSELISFRIDWVYLLDVQGDSQELFSSTTVGKHYLFGAQPSLLNGSCVRAICKDSLVCEGVILNLICATGLAPIFQLVEHLLGDLEKGSG